MKRITLLFIWIIAFVTVCIISDYASGLSDMENVTKIYAVIGNEFVELDENGNVLQIIDSGFISSSGYFPVKDVNRDAVWLAVFDPNHTYVLKRYSLNNYVTEIEMFCDTCPGSSSMTQSPDGTLYLGVTSGYSGRLIKIWGTDSELYGYDFSDNTGVNHKVITTDVGSMQQISYQSFDDTILVASGHTHRWKKFTTLGNKIFDLPTNWGHSISFVASPYENVGFGGASTNIKKIDGDGNVIFTVGKRDQGIIPTPDGGLITGNYDNWWDTTGYIRKYDRYGALIYSTLRTDSPLYLYSYEEYDGNQILWVKKGLRAVKIWGTNNELNGYNFNSIAGTNHKSFEADFRSPILVIKRPIVNISANIDIHPDTLNLKSNGNWITCYMELPEGYDIYEIDTSSVTLNIYETAITAEASPTEVGDYDNDGVFDLMVKFDREAVHNAIYETGLLKMTVNAQSYDGVCFEGNDTVLVIDRGKGRAY